MDNITTYKIWAPNNAMWTEWAKPAMFSKSDINYIGSFTCEDINWIDKTSNTIIIVDLKGANSVIEGIALARKGFRPVPLYNGVKGPIGALVNAIDLERALYWGAEMLQNIKLKDDANPVFLLDSNRMNENKYPGAYDNRWCIFPQDMPSADYLINKGINKIIVRAESIQNDLSHVLCRYQEKGIQIMISDGEKVRNIEVTKPSRYKSFVYRMKVILGLRRNSAGGFGGYVPDPSQYNSGTGYRGIG